MKVFRVSGATMRIKRSRYSKSDHVAPSEKGLADKRGL